MDSPLSQYMADITETARACLCNSPYASLRTLSCDVENGVLLLRGRLSSFHYKQMAQETVRSLAGVSQVVNEIEVVD